MQLGAKTRLAGTVASNTNQAGQGYALTAALMGPHFRSLFSRIVHGMPVLVSSNCAAVFIGALAFALTETALFLTTPKEERNKRLIKNLVIGGSVTLAVYAILFVWSTVQTVFDDHNDRVGRWRAVVNEKDQLKLGLAKRDDYIRHMQDANQKLTDENLALKKRAPFPTVSQSDEAQAKEKARRLEIRNKLGDLWVQLL